MQYLRDEMLDCLWICNTSHTIWAILTCQALLRGPFPRKKKRYDLRWLAKIDILPFWRCSGATLFLDCFLNTYVSSCLAIFEIWDTKRDSKRWEDFLSRTPQKWTHHQKAPKGVQSPAPELQKPPQPCPAPELPKPPKWIPRTPK